MTINEALSHQKTLNNRLRDLISLRNENSAGTTRYLGAHADREIQREPRYDVIKLDTRVTRLQSEIERLDRAIKNTNAVTQVIDYIADVEVLAPIEK